MAIDRPHAELEPPREPAVPARPESGPSQAELKAQLLDRAASQEEAEPEADDHAGRPDARSDAPRADRTAATTPASAATERRTPGNEPDPLAKREAAHGRAAPADRRVASEPRAEVSALERKLDLLDRASTRMTEARDRDGPPGPDDRAGRSDAGDRRSNAPGPAGASLDRPDAGLDRSTTSKASSALDRKLDLLAEAGAQAAVEARNHDRARAPDNLGWRLSRVWRESRPTDAGRAFYEKNDETMYGYALAVEPATGAYTADLHGTSNDFRVGRRALDARQLGALIRADDAWGGQPVRLMSCETGQGDNPVAQQLADELGVTVTAPTELVFSDQEGNVWTTSMTVDENDEPIPTIPPDGQWIDFKPRNEGRPNV
jgi:hypothetical protein